MGAGPSGGRKDLFQCDLETVGETAVARVKGDIDLLTAPDFEQAIRHQIEAGRNVVVDLSATRYADSNAINVLLKLGKALGERRSRLVLAAPSPLIARVLEIMAVTDLVPILPTVNAALAHLHGWENPNGQRDEHS